MPRISEAAPARAAVGRGAQGASDPLVSVIMIFLDQERFIEEAIGSVFAQSYTAWELLLVDDGSTDGSSAIARRCAATHPGRARYLEHPAHANLGMSAARNAGIRHARGELLAFLDADDVWLPETLAGQVALLRSAPETGMVFGAAEYWRTWAGDPQAVGRDEIPDLLIPPGIALQPPQLLVRLLEGRACAPCPSTMLVRGEVARAVGGFEEAFRGLYEDQAFLAKICLTAPVLASTDCWARYRQHPGSCCAAANADGSRGTARARYLQWLETHLQRQGLRGSELWRIVHLQRRADGAPVLARVRHVARRLARQTARHALPTPMRRWLRERWRGEASPPPPGRVRFGSLRRVTPIGRRWGADRGGRPIDRYYIEGFLAAHAADIRGRVLEAGDDTYTRRYGGDAVRRSDVLCPVDGQPHTTLVADLVRGDGIPTAAFDCVILTQVLQMLAEPEAAMRTVCRILKPGGVVLATLPGISQISRWDMERWGDYWRFTTLSAQRLFASVFPPGSVTIAAHGNVLAAVAFLHGLAAEELRPEELDHRDADFQLLITARAVKPRADRRRQARLEVP